MRRAGLTVDGLLPTCLAELAGFMPLGILSNFSDDLQCHGVRAVKWPGMRDIETFSIFPVALSRRLAFPMGRSSWPPRETPPSSGGSVYRFGKSIYTYPLELAEHPRDARNCMHYGPVHAALA